MTTGRKAAADRLFAQDAKKRNGNYPLTPYDENPNNTAEQKRQIEENQQQQALLDKQSKDAADEAMKNQQEAQRNIDEQSGLIGTERDKTISDQESLARNAEDNRLNQLRGNIMSRLAQR